jgi:hypothetical protein
MSTTFRLKSSYFNMRNEESFRQLIICNNSERTDGNRNGGLNECINCNRKSSKCIRRVNKLKDYFLERFKNQKLVTHSNFFPYESISS